MKRNKVRNWIYAILKLLPLFVFPILAIYTHRHESTNYEVQVSQNEVVDFNQLQYYPLTSNSEVRYSNMPNYDISNQSLLISSLPSGYTNPQITYLSLPIGKYYVRFSWTNTVDKPVLVRLYKTADDTNYLYRTVAYSYFSEILDFTYVTNFNITFNINPAVDVPSTQELIKLNIFNLTQMFGAGNEPTIQQFNAWYPNDYYEHTLSRKELLKDVSTTIYNNTDIGSQVLYSFYIPVHDYFNFKDYFGLNGVYDFMQLNMFDGNAPLPFFIVFNVIAYNLIIDLLLLVYSAFMFVIDFAFKCLDKFYGRSDK